jgi:excinuclease ABC subunit C
VRGWFSWHGFVSFGANSLDAGLGPPTVQRVHGRRPAVLRHKVRQCCPQQPGVYGMIDPHGELIYVGKAKNLRRRLLGYFCRKGRDPKAGRILRHTRALLWEHAPSDFAALLRELALIRRWRPRFNVAGQPGRRFHTYVCLGRQPAPYLFLSRRPPAGILACFGPIASSQRATAAVRRLNDWYQLRDCPQAQTMVFADQAELFTTDRTAGCLRYEIGTCLGPCAAACTRSAYGDQVRAVRGFLEGGDRVPLERLEQDMAAAAAVLDYERAAMFRDRLEPLRWLHDQLARLRLAREELSFIYPVSGVDGRELWYVIRAGRVVHVLGRPTAMEEKQAAAAAIQAAFDRPYPREGALSGREIDTVLLVAAWFRRYPAERERALPLTKVLAGLGE